MMRPLTILCLLAALGSGLYLYQEKHRALLLDRDITRTVKLADAGRDRIGLLRAEWQSLTEHDRLTKLAAQYLALQPLVPTQYVQMADLANRLPAVVIAAPEAAPVDEPPAPLSLPAPPPAHAPIVAAVPAAKPPAALAVAAPLPVHAPPKPAPVQLAAVHPEPPHPPATKPEPLQRVAAAKPEPDAIRPAPLRPVFAPIVPAYQPGPALVHPPTVQSAAATTSTYAASSYAAATPFVGSALGMGRTTLAAPVPIASTNFGR